MPSDFLPMPDDPADQQRVHGTVPKEVYRLFKQAFPQHGAIQFAIRLVMECLPRMANLDEAYKIAFMQKMAEMYEEDRKAAEIQRRAAMADPRQINFLDLPNTNSL